MRKLMALSDPSKTRRHQPKHSVSSLQSLGSPNSSPPSLRKAGTRSHERVGHSGGGDHPSTTTKLSLTAEDSSVTSLPALRKATNSASSMGPSERRTHGNLRIGPHSIPRARVGRTLSRERKTKPKPQDTDDDDDIDTQVSAV